MTLPILLLLSSVRGAQAFSITVDPVNYLDIWDLAGVRHQGPSTVNLGAGTWQLNIGGSDSVQFDVLADGTVANADAVSLIATGSTVRFVNTVAHVDVAEYAGAWSMPGVSRQNGDASPTLVPGLSYAIHVGYPSTFLVEVLADGTLSTAASGAGAQASCAGSTLTFNTTLIDIDTGAFTGTWTLDAVTSRGSLSRDDIAVVPGLTYSMQVASPGSFRFFVAEDGTVSTEPTGATAQATGAGAVLTLNNTLIDVDTGAYTGTWTLDAVTSRGNLSRAGIVVVPGLPYSMQVAYPGKFALAVAADGSVSTSSGAATGIADVLRFNTRTADVDVAAYAGWWGIDAVVDRRQGSLDNVVLVHGLPYTVNVAYPGSFRLDLSGAGVLSVASGSAITDDGSLIFQTVDLTISSDGYPAAWGVERVGVASGGLLSAAVVPDVTYRLSASGYTSNFTVSAACVVNPTTLSSGGYTWYLDCDDGPGDSDADGYADDADNCPATPNDQFDLDFDGVGDVCDEDRDGDGFANSGDLCPDAADDQGDTDNDGLGDACDDDIDDDGWDNGFDPCPFDFENDEDGDGICEIADLCPLDPANDVDGDGLCADVDPCPTDPANDADGNGVCDTDPVCVTNAVDTDGDGMCDGIDLCPLDPLNDADLDGWCAEEDICPSDPDNDVDLDGLCADEDPCPADRENDSDSDGRCGDVDPCPYDAEDDVDGDGQCADIDLCPYDFENDIDNDGLCHSVDTCVLDPLNDFDADGTCGDIDLCPFDPENDADADAVCEIDDLCPLDPANDADGDGICGDEDACPDASNIDTDGDATCDSIDACWLDAANDADADGWCADADDCPTSWDPNQEDLDNDGAGDPCDVDDDGDIVVDVADTCPTEAAGTPDLLADGCPDEICDIGAWLRSLPAGQMDAKWGKSLLVKADHACASGDPADLQSLSNEASAQKGKKLTVTAADTVMAAIAVLVGG